MSSEFQNYLVVANMKFVLHVFGSRFCTKANERENVIFYHYERNLALEDFVLIEKNYMHHLIFIHLS